MTIQTTDDRLETAGFKIADQKIVNLLKRLHEKSVCPCCAARALTYRAAFMAELTMGSVEAIEMFEAAIMCMREHDAPAPDRAPSVAEH